jgi:peptidoglycan/xylan/chitin deacetylase (PgdA/CDA1 family)
MIKPIGLFSKELGWQQILDQERVNYEIVTGQLNLERYGLVILTRSPNTKELSAIRYYLESGGGILTDFTLLDSLLPDFDCHRIKTRYVIPTSDNIFNNVGLIDVGRNGYAPYETSTPKVYMDDYGQGKIIALPFDVNQALINSGSRTKFFCYPAQKLPYETVAEVSSGEIRKLIINCLRILYKHQNLYYLHLWYYPATCASVFTFRVDTDFSAWDNIQTVIRLAQDNELSFTWFVNTKAQKDYLPDFPEVQKSGQDIQLHCFLHNVFSDYVHNRDNIAKGKELLKSVGIEPVGFAAPFGEWNEDLAQVLEDFDFRYSSEFTLAYDDLPFNPVVLEHNSKVLQIPVHPICVGRLLQAGFDYNQILLYFKRYINLGYQTREPIMIYDHPHRIHQIPQVFDEIFKNVKDLKNIWITNYTQLAQWWKQRETIAFNGSILQGQLKIITPKENPKCTLHIISPSGQESFLPLRNGNYPLDQLTWLTMPEPIMVEEGIERIRQGEFILQIKEFINTLDRRMKGQRA